jgi:ATP-binding cassette, subfamily B, multidrug efflux pump
MEALRHLNKYFINYKMSLIIGFLFVACSNVFGILSAQVIRFSVNLINEYIQLFQLYLGTDVIHEILIDIITVSLFAFSALYLIFHLIKGSFMFLMRQTIIVTSRKIEYDLKNEIFTHFQALPLSFFKQNHTGDLMTRITEDVTRVRMYAGPALMYTMNLITLFIITISIMMIVNIELSIYALTPLPILSFLIYKVSSVMYKKGEKIQNTLSNLATISQEVFSGIRVVKSYGRSQKFQSLFKEESEDYHTKSMELAKVESLFFPLMTLLIGLSTILIILIGGKQVISGKITYGNIVEFVYYINLLTWPVTAIGWIASLYQRAKVSQGRINQFLETPVQDLNKHGIKHDINGSIEFKNVHFTYPETGIPAIQGIDLKIEKGQKIAIVGKTGSGKTSIANLLLKFYNPNEGGTILLDDKPLNDFAIKPYRDQIGYVSQDVFLFSDTIKNNINFGLEQSTEDELKKHIKIAELEKDIDQFSDGLDTKIGERGISLSGGQKQRITIARALIRNPKLLIFDDCLSSVDANTEFNIFKNLNEETQDRTALIITHRVLSLNKMDQIIVLESGKIKEAGSFDQLIAKKGSFYGLYQKQKLEESS